MRNTRKRCQPLNRSARRYLSKALESIEMTASQWQTAGRSSMTDGPFAETKEKAGGA